MARLLMFNKPYGVLSRFTVRGSPTARATLSDFNSVPGVYPAGRLLDRASDGLLLLTGDGRLQARIADPRFKLPKNGMSLPVGALRIAARELWPLDPSIRVRKAIPDSWLRLILRERRNRQVRRMTTAVDLPSLRLVRWPIGDRTLGGIGPGQFVELAV